MGAERLDLMFHTGVTAVSLTEASARKVTSVKWDKSSRITSWGGGSTARLSEGNTLQMGNKSWNKVSFTEDKLSGTGTDGKFGCNLFQGGVIEIDFDKSVLTVHSSMPEVDKSYERLVIDVDDGVMFVEGIVRVGTREMTNRFLVHTGFGGTILLDDKFVAAHILIGELKTLGEKQLRDSLGNVLTTKKVALPALRFGRTEFSEVPVGLFDGALGRQKMSVVGGDLLKRFNMLIDLQQGQLYLKPNKLFDVPFVE